MPPCERPAAQRSYRRHQFTLIPKSEDDIEQSSTKPSMTVAAWQGQRSDLGHSDQPGQTVGRGNAAPYGNPVSMVAISEGVGVCSCRAAAVTRRHAGAGGSHDAVDRRRQPLDRGPLVGELPQFSRGFDDWLLLERTRVAEVIAEMLRRIAAAAHIVSYDSYAAAVTAASLVALDPLDAARNGYAPNVRQNPGDAILLLRAQQFRRCERREATSRREHALYSCQPRGIASRR
jgi:hypothetical protein